MNRQAEWLAAYVERCMIEHWGEGIDDLEWSGEVVTFRAGTARCSVLVEDTAPMMVRVMATAVQDVRPSLKLLREINEINAAARVVSVWWYEGSVVVECSLFADAVDAGSLGAACRHVAHVANDIGVGFAAMYDGSTPCTPHASDSEDAA